MVEQYKWLVIKGTALAGFKNTSRFPIVMLGISWDLLPAFTATGRLQAVAVQDDSGNIVDTQDDQQAGQAAAPPNAILVHKQQFRKTLVMPGHSIHYLPNGSEVAFTGHGIQCATLADAVNIL